MFIRSIVIGTSLLITAGSALAHSEVNFKGDGYISGNGTVFTTGLGTCLRSGVFPSDGQKNSCDPEEEVVEAVVVAPEPEPEPVPEPEPIRKIQAASLNGLAQFETDSSVLTDAGRNRIVTLLTEIVKLDEIETITVTGHTDSRGSESYNQGLSERRAQAVADLLSGRYGDADISVIGMGEISPVATNDTPEGRQENRRVEVTIDGKRVIFN